MLYCPQLMPAPQEQPTPLDARRQDILRRSPILHEIIYNADISTETLSKTQTTIYNRIRRTYGRRNSQNLISASLELQTTNASNSFIINDLVDKNRLDTDEEALEAYNTVGKMLVFLGFEIGNMEDARLFIDELTQFIQIYDADRNGKLFSDKGREMLKDVGIQNFLLKSAVYQGLRYGEALRALMTKGDMVQPIPTPPSKGPMDLSVYSRGFSLDSTLDPNVPIPGIPGKIAEQLAGIDFSVLNPPQEYTKPPQEE